MWFVKKHKPETHPLSLKGGNITTDRVMPTITQQISRVFREHGMEPKETEYNNDTEQYRVSVQADGSDDRFLRPVGELGTEGSVDHQLDFSTVKSMRSVIHGTEIPDGVITVEEIESEYFVISIE